MNVFEISVTGAVLIFAVILFRAVGKKRLPMRTFTVLWHVALLRLLLPFGLPSPFSAASIGQKLIRPLAKIFSRPDGAGAADISASPASSGVSHGTFFFETAPSDAPPISEAFHTAGGIAQESASSARFAPDWRLIVWIAGAVLCLSLFAAFYVRALKRFRQSLPLESDFARDWLAVHAPRRKIEVRVSDRIDSPLTYGILRPVILLPSDTDLADTRRLEFILAHEFTHIRHFDSLTKLLLSLAVALHWFNPAVWLMFFFFNRDMELACDEAVVRMFGGDTRREYALMLVELIEKKPLPVLPANGFGQGALKERIGAIMKVKRITWAVSLAAVIAVCGITAVFATTAAKEEPEKPAAEQISSENEADSVGSSADTELCWPLSPDAVFTVSAEWGWRMLYGNEDFHRGIDLACESGTGVLAYSGGTVTISEYHYSYGNYVVIDHGTGPCTLYASLSERLVNAGEPVAAGQLIGRVGMTGSTYSYHLHFEVLKDGTPMNPRDYLDLTGDYLKGVFPTAQEERSASEAEQRAQEEAARQLEEQTARGLVEQTEEARRLEAERLAREAAEAAEKARESEVPLWEKYNMTEEEYMSEKNLKFREKLEEKEARRLAEAELERLTAEWQARLVAEQEAHEEVPEWERLGISEEEYMQGEKYQKYREKMEQKQAERIVREARARAEAELREKNARDGE